MTDLTEPAPLWPEAPRYCPMRTLPAYRFVPGLNPHPTGQEQGHSFGSVEAPLSYLPPERWQENENYLFGVDLYHRGYFWEAHEAWEQLWHLCDKTGLEGQFLQGLIQNAAAQLKRHLRNASGASHLSREAYRRLSHVFDRLALSQQVEFMGLNLVRFLEDMNSHYGPLWSGAGNATADAPRMILHRN